MNPKHNKRNGGELLTEQCRRLHEKGQLKMLKELFNALYGNVENKIKGFAKFICIVQIILSIVIGGAVLFIGLNQYHDLGFTPVFIVCILTLVIILGGMYTAWLSTVFMYGFGQLIENTKPQSKTENPSEVEAKTEG